MKPPRPGEIYAASLDGSEPHLVIVVSREDLNRGHYVTIVPVTSRRFELRSMLPNCLPFSAGEFAFGSDCVAQAENITLLEKGWIDLASGPLGRLDSARMRGLIHAIGYVIDSECEPT